MPGQVSEELAVGMGMGETDNQKLWYPKGIECVAIPEVVFLNCVCGLDKTSRVIVHHANL